MNFMRFVLEWFLIFSGYLHAVFIEITLKVHIKHKMLSEQTVCGLDNYNAEIELGMVMVKVSFGCCSFENY